MNAIRTLIVDDHDHDLVRAGLRLLLQSMEGIEVVGEAANGRDAVAAARSHRPDVVLMDLMMPELNGLDATARIVSRNPGVHVVILSMTAGDEAVLPVMRAGASGYCLKNVRPAELELAIRAAARGETYLCAAVSRHVVDACFAKSGSGEDQFERLSARQREVLQLIAEGRSAKEIAGRLEISVRTAETHRAQLMNALDIHDTAGLVRFAIRRGLITA
jgi:DNA-binding NarL/FixJ family response regulator